MRLGSSTKVWGPRRFGRSRSAAEVCLHGAPGASRYQSAVRSHFTGARWTASFLGAKRFLRNLAELAADMWMDDSNPSRTDVDRDGTHLVVRSTHLRNLHVPDPRVAGREDAEFDDAVGDELLDAGPRQILARPLLAPWYRKWDPKIVFPVPGRPVKVMRLPVKNPPSSIPSSSGSPVGARSSALDSGTLATAISVMQ